jgi:hypothetical protein
MGGFVLHDGDGPPRALSLEEIECRVRRGEVDFPVVTKQEIKDKSKSDAVTKGLVLIQTTWFLLQCAARGVRHLSLTELELVTAAFALLNLITYALWWDKPLNVKCPVRVVKKHVRGPGSQEETTSAGKEAGRRDIREDGEVGGDRIKFTFAGRIRNRWSEVPRGWSWYNVKEGVVMALGRVFGPFVSMAMQDSQWDEPTFSAGQNEDENQATKARYGAAVVSMIFGTIHCLAWSFPFPSHTELILWRISSIAMTAVPPFISLVLSFPSRYIDQVPDVTVFAFILILSSATLYVIARVALFVLALMALRSLPPSAFQVVRWTTFLPHI